MPKLWLLQHEELSKLRIEEKNTNDYEVMAHSLAEIDGQLKELEARLKRVSAAEEHQVMEECLVTRTVPNEEVRANLQDWIPAMEDEYKSLLQHGAIRPLSEAEYKKIKNGPEVLDVIPGLVVATVKAPNARKKCCIVGCGNFVSKENAITDNISAGGIDGIALRTLASSAARRNWNLASVDVKTAFLQAARRVRHQGG